MTNDKRTEELTAKAITYIKDLFRDDAGGHGADHTLRVWQNALRIARGEPGCDGLIVSLAALLHDADDHKLFQTENNANARAFLNENDVSPETADRICEAINDVSFSKNKGKTPSTPEGKIVQDADRLDAIGAVGIARIFAYGGEHGRPLQESVQHFYDKLLQLKDLMNTESARRLAVKRHAFLESFLRQLDEETGAIDPEEAGEVRWVDGFELSAKIICGSAVISGNREGLLSLANLLTDMAGKSCGDHIHLDEYNSLEEGSDELVLEKLADGPIKQHSH